MPMRKAPKPNTDELAILSRLLADFKERRLAAFHLQTSYEGVNVAGLKELLISESVMDEVDFDLALNGLEDKGLVHTGPLVAYTNDPRSDLVFVGAGYSRKEWVILNETGYTAAKEAPRQSPAAGSPRISIEGNVYGSTIAAGTDIQQSVVSYPSDQWFTEAQAAVQGSFTDPSVVTDLTVRLEELQLAANTKDGFPAKAKAFLTVLANACTIAQVTMPVAFHLVSRYLPH
jgi:hypothetical protein